MLQRAVVPLMPQPQVRCIMGTAAGCRTLQAAAESGQLCGGAPVRRAGKLATATACCNLTLQAVQPLPAPKLRWCLPDCSKSCGGACRTAPQDAVVLAGLPPKLRWCLPDNHGLPQSCGGARRSRLTLHWAIKSEPCPQMSWQAAFAEPTRRLTSQGRS